MKQITKEELIEVIDGFINSNGLWNDFKAYIEEQGYTVKELGFKE